MPGLPPADILRVRIVSILLSVPFSNLQPGQVVYGMSFVPSNSTTVRGGPSAVVGHPPVAMLLQREGHLVVNPAKANCCAKLSDQLVLAVSPRSGESW